MAALDVETKRRKRGEPKPEPVAPDLSWMIPHAESGLDDVLSLFSQVNRYDRGDSELSVTQLINAPQQVALEKLNAEAVKKDADAESVFAIMGKAVHKILEDANPSDSLVEERFFTIEQGVKISGSIDRVKKLPDGTYELIDYKVTSMWSLKDGVKPSWEWQLNMYAYLLEKIYGIKVSRLRVVAILRDFSQARAQPYAPRPIVFVAVPLWNFAAREAFVKRRIMLHKQAQQDLEHGKLPHQCTPEETWDTDRAKAWYAANGGHSRYYMDEPRKCDNYCNVKKWCAQHMQWKLGTTFESEVANVGSADDISKNKGSGS
jgi:hypothetical protein